MLISPNSFHGPKTCKGDRIGRTRVLERIISWKFSGARLQMPAHKNIVAAETDRLHSCHDVNVQRTN